MTFPGNTDAIHFKPVAIQLCHHNLLPFCFKWLCAATILRPFLFAVTLRVLEAARAAVPVDDNLMSLQMIMIATECDEVRFVA